MLVSGHETDSLRSIDGETIDNVRIKYRYLIHLFNDEIEEFLKTSHFYSSHDTLQESLKHRLVVRKDLQHELDQSLKYTNLVLMHGVSGSGKT